MLTDGFSLKNSNEQLINCITRLPAVINRLLHGIFIIFCFTCDVLRRTYCVLRVMCYVCMFCTLRVTFYFVHFTCYVLSVECYVLRVMLYDMSLRSMICVRLAFREFRLFVLGVLHFTFYNLGCTFYVFIF